jgi:HPt (histidine-containing phosphotransfer) domain-containing protein
MDGYVTKPIRDADEARRSAHTIKGNLRTLGETPAAHLAERLEQLGKAGNLRQAADLLPALRQEVQRVLEQVRNFVASAASS